MKTHFLMGAVCAGVALIAFLFVRAAEHTIERSNVDCELQRETKKELAALGHYLVAEVSDGSLRTELESRTDYLGFYCRTTCIDGSTGAACTPARGERVSVRCRYSIDEGICRHTLWISGVYVDENLIKRLKSRVATRKRRFLEK